MKKSIREFLLGIHTRKINGYKMQRKKFFLNLSLPKSLPQISSLFRYASIISNFYISQIVAGISVFFICTSVISFCLKTLPAMRVEIPITPTVASNHSGSINMNDIYQTSTTEMNFIPTTTQRPSGLFNRYSVNNFSTQKLYLCCIFFL